MNLKKVVIVDDEYLIRELLHEKINWKKLRCEIVLKATCASEVMDYIEEEEVDLIITDINMPFIGGMEMAQRIRKSHPKIKIIILTGYNEFEYAKKGIDIGIDGFILKPIDKDEVESDIEKAVKKIDSERNQAIELHQLRQRLEEGKPYLKEKMFFDVVGGTVSEAAIAGKFERYSINSQADGYRIAVIQLAGKVEEQEMTEYRCKIMVEGYFDTLNGLDNALEEDGQKVHVFADTSGQIHVLFTGTDIMVYDELMYCQRMIMENLGLEVKMGISSVKEHIGLLSDADTEAVNCLKFAFFEGSDAVCSYDDFNIDTEEFNIIKERHHVDEKLLQLQFYLKSGLGTEVDNTLDDIFNSYKKVLSRNLYEDSNYIHVQLARIISTIQQTVLSLSADTKEELEKDTRFNELSNFGKISEVRMLSELGEWIKEYCAVILGCVSRNQISKDENVIDSINAYIYENIGNSSLTMKGTAEKFYLNPSYLSRIYKKQMGYSFKERLFNLRMEKAVELLKETDMKVYEVGNSVGIEDPNYFSHCFKKYMQMSVSEFRKKIAVESN